MLNFVGAGPGAKDLITVKGMNLLKEADVLIYAGSLVSDRMLEYTKDNCVIYDSARMSLDEVIAVINKAEAEGLNVVRLHTGDPSVYGAIKEQMDRLDELGIGYEVVPGVSSFCGAAAALKAEYTLPNVSQSVIITRMEGRTKVPELEKLSELAKHKSTMVIFLSASMTDLVAKELIKGGYDENTPAAIVYRASWPDEKVIRCTVGTLNKCAKENNITRHALITVGSFLGTDYELSKLYDSGFSTGYRAAKTEETIKVSIIAFSEKGLALANQISTSIISDTKYAVTNICRCNAGELNDWTAMHFRQDDALIFVGACGIATRAIAPFINHKTVDPAVIVVDELGKNVIPLLSGHIGGANKLTELLADKLCANACITTATDINDVWAVDSWAVSKGMSIKNSQYIKAVSSKLLNGETIGVDSCISLSGLPDTVLVGGEDTDVLITYKKTTEDKLVLVPKVLSVGIGCKKGASFGELRKQFNNIIEQNNIDVTSIKQLSSIDLKENEACIKELAGELGVPFVTYSAERLNSLTGAFASSEFVKQITGVDSVSERSAVMGAGGLGDDSLIVRKTAENGVTIAIAIQSKI